MIGSDGKASSSIEFFRCKDPHVDVNGERIDVEDVDRYLLQLENFSEAVRGEAEPLLGREDALGQARTIEALYRPRRQHRLTMHPRCQSSPRKVSCSRRPPALERTIASPISDAR